MYRYLQRWLSRSAQGCRAPQSRPPVPYRPALEVLEGRQLLSAGLSLLAGMHTGLLHRSFAHHHHHPPHPNPLTTLGQQASSAAPATIGTISVSPSPGSHGAPPVITTGGLITVSPSLGSGGAPAVHYVPGGTPGFSTASPSIVLPPLGAAPPPATPSSSPTALVAVDPNLASPTVTMVRSTDNSVFVAWNDTNTAQDGYIVTVWEHGAHDGPTEFRLPKTARSFWFNGLNHAINPSSVTGRFATLGEGSQGNGALTSPLRPGVTYDILVWAESPCAGSGNTACGVSSNTTTVQAQLTAPTIRIGDPNTGATSTPTALQSFAWFDADNEGIVNSATGSGGTYPFFPSSNGADSAVQAGNTFDSENGVRANVIVGYVFQEGQATRFAAFHLSVDSVHQTVTPVAMFYGDTQPGVPGALVWSGTAPVVSQAQVTSGSAADGTPDTVSGEVTAQVLATDGSLRVVDFTFNLALQNA